MPRLDPTTLTRTLTADALEHPDDLVQVLAARHGVSRGTVSRRLKRLQEQGWLRRVGQRPPRYEPGPLRELNREYPTAGLDEHTAWCRDVQPLLALSPPVARLAQHVFGELLNNAIDHAHAAQVRISVRQTPSHLHLLICDDGTGLFTQLARRAALESPQQAALELAKGRLTTQPECHGGRGLFFVARMVDALDLQADGQVLQWRARAASVRLRPHPLRRPGTTVFVSLPLQSTLRPSDVYAEWGSDAAPLGFSRTQVPLRLLAGPDLALDSRAQARWVVSRLELFATAELDFDGVEDIGPSFIDEVFRVYAQAHPEVRLTASHASAPVQRLLPVAGLSAPDTP